MGLPGEENSYFQAEDNFENIDITSKDITAGFVRILLDQTSYGYWSRYILVSMTGYFLK